MTDDKIANNSYRKLLYFFSNKIAVHFKDFNNIFYNGIIEDLNEEKKTLILKERVRGTMPLILEDIDPKTIVKMEEKK